MLGVRLQLHPICYSGSCPTFVPARFCTNHPPFIVMWYFATRSSNLLSMTLSSALFRSVSIVPLEESFNPLICGKPTLAISSVDRHANYELDCTTILKLFLFLELSSLPATKYSCFLIRCAPMELSRNIVVRVTPRERAEQR